MKRRAFTLVEVLISIAIAVVLILGISQIFAIAQRTTGAGTAVLASAETDRGVMTTLTRDFRSMVDGNQAPAIVLSSYSIAAFRSRADMNADVDGQASTLNPVVGNISQPGQFCDVNERIHRLDKLCFFVRSSNSRQTANQGSPNLTSNTSSDEAFVWYGHLALPNNAMLIGWTPATPQSAGGNPNAAYMNPGVPATAPKTNDNNRFASDWVLGRQVILLLPQIPAGENYFPGPNPCSLTASVENSTRIPLWASRFDLGATSIDQYRNYFIQLAYPSGFNSPPSSTPWGWDQLIGYTGGYAFLDPRFAANPYPIKPKTPTTGWMAAAIAQTSPILARGCSQFIVEFAGNFVTQDENPTSTTFGEVLSAQPAPTGKLDFVPFKDSSGQWMRRVRWYGFPRNPAGEAGIGVSGTNGQFQSGVCPLRDTLFSAPDVNTVYPAASYPKVAAGFAPPERAAPLKSANYLGAMPAADGVPSSYYLCAWGPDTLNFPQPKLIRITFALDDPAGHLNTSQSYEYVFSLP